MMLSETPAGNPSIPTKCSHIPCGLELPPSTPQLAARNHQCASPPIEAHTTVHPSFVLPLYSVREAITKQRVQRSENSTTLSNVSPECYRRLGSLHTYFPLTNTLLLRPISTPVHRIVQAFFSSFHTDMRDSGFLDDRVYHFVDSSSQSVKLDGIARRYQLLKKNKKKMADIADP
ncbi:hypothetical protein BGX38DRAFT_1226621, partial [Terfezia claveryi]